MTRQTVEIYTDLLAEGMHVAFRKASDHEAAARAHLAICDLPQAEWDNIVQFVLEGSRILDNTPPK